MCILRGHVAGPRENKNIYKLLHLAFGSISFCHFTGTGNVTNLYIFDERTYDILACTLFFSSFSFVSKSSYEPKKKKKKYHLHCIASDST